MYFIYKINKYLFYTLFTPLKLLSVHCLPILGILWLLRLI